MKHERKVCADNVRTPATQPVSPREGEAPANSPQWERRRIMQEIQRKRENLENQAA
jgi:hypothetical protein